MGNTSNWSYSGIYEYEVYEIEFSANGTYYYDSGRMYMPNGDPGYPPEEDFDVDEVTLDFVRDKSAEAIKAGTDEVDVYDSLDTETKELIEEAIVEALYDGKYEVNYDEPYYPEPEEYEDD